MKLDPCQVLRGCLVNDLMLCFGQVFFRLEAFISYVYYYTHACLLSSLRPYLYDLLHIDTILSVAILYLTYNTNCKQKLDII